MEEKGIKTQIEALDDAQLYGLINAVAVSSGLDAKKTEKLCSDIPRLRRMLQSLDEAQIKTLMSTLSDKDISDILKRL